MTTEQNKATIRRFYEEVWGKGNVDFTFNVFAEDYIHHDLRPTKALPGPEGQRKIALHFRAAFLDPEWIVDLILTEGGEDNVLVIVGSCCHGFLRYRCIWGMGYGKSNPDSGL